jgi:ankyrin repeat protein
MKKLLLNGVNVLAKSEEQSSALHHVTTVEGTQLLLDKGARINVFDAGKYTPLYKVLFSPLPWSHQRNRVWKEIATLLLKSGANINELHPLHGTLLHHAIYKEDVGVVDFLLSNNIDTNRRDDNNRTAFAVLIGKDKFLHYDPAILTLFEKYGMFFFCNLKPWQLFKKPDKKLFSANTYDEKDRLTINKFAALSMCAKAYAARSHKMLPSFDEGILFNQYGCVVTSLSDQDFKDNFGEENVLQVMKLLQKVTHHAVSLIGQEDHDKLKQWIKQFPWIVRYDERKSYYMMMEAIWAKSPNCLEVLLEEGIDPQRCCASHEDAFPSTVGGTYVQLAVLYDRPEAIKLLIAHGVDCLEKGEYGETPLQCAVSLKRQECIDVLNKELCEQCYKAYEEDNYSRAQQLLAHIIDPTIVLVKQLMRVHYAGRN